MPGRLSRHCIPALVGIYRMFAQKIDLAFVQQHHFGRQQKYRHVIDLSMAIKTPGMRRELRQQQSRYQQ